MQLHFQTLWCQNNLSCVVLLRQRNTVTRRSCSAVLFIFSYIHIHEHVLYKYCNYTYRWSSVGQLRRLEYMHSFLRRMNTDTRRNCTAVLFIFSFIHIHEHAYINIAIIPLDDPVLGEWEDWSMCTVSCGEGTRTCNRSYTPGRPCSIVIIY